MRASEVLGLRVADFSDHGEDIVFRVHAADDNGVRRLKTDASVRLLAVHPEAMRRGFREYLAQLKRDGETWLFPSYFDTPAKVRAIEAAQRGDLEGADAKLANAVGTWFNGQCKRAGVEGLTMHKLRHRWRDRATAAGLDKLAVERLGGWTASSMSGHYGSGIGASADEVAALVGRVDFSEDLGNLPQFKL